MKTFRNLILGVLALAALVSFQQSAFAAASTVVSNFYLCAPDVAVGPPGPRRVTNPGTSGGSYSLNNQGCALISTSNSDAAYFMSQGYTIGTNLYSLTQTGMTANTTASTSTITLPANAFIVGIVIQESAGNAVTSGLNIGNATSATAYASAVTVGANALVSVADSALTRVYPATTPTKAEQILLAAAGSWNSANLNVTIFYAYF